MSFAKSVRIVGYLALATVLGTLGLMFFDTAYEGLAADETENKDAPIAYRGARIHTASGPVIERGVLLVHKGKIVASDTPQNLTQTLKSGGATIEVLVKRRF